MIPRLRSGRAALAALAALLTAATARPETILVADKTGDALLVFDTVTGRVKDSIPTGANPHEVVATADGRRAFTANAGSNTVSVIDLVTRAEYKRIGSTLLRYPHGMAIHPDGKTLYLTSEQNRLLLVIDVASLDIKGQIPTGKEGSHMIVLSPGGEIGYVADRGSAAVTVVDTKKAAVLEHMPAGEGVEGIALSPDGKWLLVGNRTANDIQLFDAIARKSVARIPVAADPVRVAISADGKRALVPHRRTSEVYLVDLASRKVVAKLKAGKEPGGALFLPGGKQAVIANTGEGTISIVDLDPFAVRSTHPAGKGPDGMFLLH